MKQRILAGLLLLCLLLSLCACGSRDEALIRLMREEINRYYDGQNSAEDTAAAIQSRASIYVSEQYG